MGVASICPLTLSTTKRRKNEGLADATIAAPSRSTTPREVRLAACGMHATL
jgi:hypothetical protein